MRLRSHEEAVFSSSEDRIRAGQAVIAGAGPSIVSRSSSSLKFSRVRHAADSLFSVAISSNRPVCGLPRLNIPHLPVSPDCLRSIYSENGRKVGRAAQVTGRDVLFVDDVHTAGATVSQRGGVLRRAGPFRPWVATVALRMKLASKYESFESGQVSQFPRFKLLKLKMSCKSPRPIRSLERRDLETLKP
jgi:hypothetical protein